MRAEAAGLRRPLALAGGLRPALGRRSLVPWKERGFSINLPEPLCRAAGVDTGDEVELEIRLAEEAVPEELASLLKVSRAAKRVWDALTDAQRRMLREEILSLKQPATRARRAERVLLGRTGR